MKIHAEMAKTLQVKKNIFGNAFTVDLFSQLICHKQVQLAMEFLSQNAIIIFIFQIVLGNKCRKKTSILFNFITQKNKNNIPG